MRNILSLCFSCQFVVTDEQDYKAHFTDPDTLVNWDCVQQVVSIKSTFPFFLIKHIDTITNVFSSIAILIMTNNFCASTAHLQP